MCTIVTTYFESKGKNMLMNNIRDVLVLCAASGIHCRWIYSSTLETLRYCSKKSIQKTKERSFWRQQKTQVKSSFTSDLEVVWSFFRQTNILLYFKYIVKKKKNFNILFFVLHRMISIESQWPNQDLAKNLEIEPPEKQISRQQKRPR